MNNKNSISNRHRENIHTLAMCHCPTSFNIVRTPTSGWQTTPNSSPGHKSAHKAPYGNREAGLSYE